MSIEIDAEGYRQHLASIVESSDDAIISKDLDGIVTSWNGGAERLFGYTAEEAIGKSVTILIPEDRLNEEPTILERIRRGERINHYETVRRRKDGDLIHVSLSVSPIKDVNGFIIGASKICRDITERRRVQEQQKLFLDEMKHRTKNLAAVIEAIGRQSRPKNEPAVDAYFIALMGRLRTLLSTGELLFESSARNADLKQVLETALQPFLDAGAPPRFELQGPPLPLQEQTAGGLALAFHELATNALKYGALKVPRGMISIQWSINDEGTQKQVVVEWKEHVTEGISEPRSTGFGTRVIHAAVSNELNGKTDLVYEPNGLRCRFVFSVR
jgi:PAS domain S-box-containing protein